MTMSLDLQEGFAERVSPTVLSSEAALAMSRSGRFDIEWASPQNEHSHVVKSRGWIGHLPITPGLMVRVIPKVPIARLFDLLEVAYNLKSFRILEGATHIESLEGLVGRLASILARRVMDRARRGLYGGYREETMELSTVRGRINATGTVRNFLQGSTALYCTFDDQTRDLEENRILLWTLHQLSWVEGLRPEVRREVRAAYRSIAGLVTLAPYLPSNCVDRLYNRLNEDYQPMHGLCRLLLEHMGPGIRIGEHDFIPFMLYMPNLFEMFMSRWLAAHLPSTIRMRTQYHTVLAASANFEVRIDIVLQHPTSGINIAVLDTKYKYVDQPSLQDIQQAAFYANQIGARRAFLVYPSQATKSLWVRNGGVTIETLVFDLNASLEEAGRAFLGELDRRLGFSTA